MRWPMRPEIDRERWHRAFAWLPVATITREWVWLEAFEQRLDPSRPGAMLARPLGSTAEPPGRFRRPPPPNIGSAGCKP